MNHSRAILSAAAFCVVITCSFLAAAPPPKVTNVRATVDRIVPNNGSVVWVYKLKWDAVPGAAYYDVKTTLTDPAGNEITRPVTPSTTASEIDFSATYGLKAGTSKRSFSVRAWSKDPKGTFVNGDPGTSPVYKEGGIGTK